MHHWHSIKIRLLNPAQMMIASLSLACLPPAMAAPKNCKFELAKDSVVVSWTAFKTSEKVAVNGSFKGIKVTGPTKAKSLASLVKGLNVRVDKDSLETGNPARNETVKTAFFNKLAGSGISGKVKAFDEGQKSLVLSLDFNGKKKDVPMTYTESGDTLKASGKMDILEFGGNEALASLNKACLDLHKGKDGVSKTWSEVDLNLEGHVQSDCPQK